MAKVKEVTMAITYDAHSQQKIGGPGMIVEIDEMHIATRKYNVGEVLRGQQDWIFGGYCRQQRQSFKVRVPRRGRIDLIPLLKRFVLPGSIICSDGWLAYVGLDHEPGYNWTHYIVIHQHQFVNHQIIPGAVQVMHPQKVHTQHIERHWRDLREIVRCHRDKGGFLDREIAYHTYVCNRFGRGDNRICVRARVVRLLQDMGRVYPASGEEFPLADWVHYNKGGPHHAAFEAWWKEVTFPTNKALVGYNIRGIGYTEQEQPEAGAESDDTIILSEAESNDSD
jgi:hypothetical protein